MTNPFDSTRFLGYVNEVSPKGIRIHVPSARLLSRFRHEGIQFPGGNVGEFALVEGDRFGFLVRILSMKLPDSERKALSEKAVCEDDSSFHPIVEAEVLISFSGTHPETVERTISRFPEIGAKVYSCPSLVLTNLLGHATDIKDNAPITVLGRLSANGLECPVSLDSIFGRHCAVVGTTGSGKSWTVARLLQSLMSQTANKVVLLDPTGEYSSLDDNRMVKSAKVGTNCHFPYENLRVSDLFTLLRPTGQAQRPVLMEAIRSLKTVQVSSSRVDNPLQAYMENGCLKKIGKTKSPVISFQHSNVTKIDDGYCSFNITNLFNQVSEECVYPSGTSNNYAVWGGYDQRTSDYQSSLRLRIQELITSKEFNDLFHFRNHENDSSSSLIDLFSDFLKSEDRCLFRIDFSNTTSVFNAREILANCIARHLYESAKHGSFRNQPILVVVDEAHLFVNKNLIDADQALLPLDAFDLIAKECRKYGLFLCLATQMPRDIPVGTLSQMGAFIVHRLINDQDRKVIEAACSSASYSSLAYLPILGPGEALVTGADFPMPLLLKIDRPRTPPRSETPRFSKRKSMPSQLEDDNREMK